MRFKSETSNYGVRNEVVLLQTESDIVTAYDVPHEVGPSVAISVRQRLHEGLSSVTLYLSVDNAKRIVEEMQAAIVKVEG